jgi:serine protease
MARRIIRDKLVVRFKTGVSLPYAREGLEQALQSLGGERWTTLSASGQVFVRPLFERSGPDRPPGSPPRPEGRPDFSKYYAFYVRPGTISLDEVRKEIKDKWKDLVEEVRKPARVIRPQVMGGYSDQSDQQDYLGSALAAPFGVDARFAWQFPGGDGSGVQLADVEAGWDMTHPGLEGLGFDQTGDDCPDEQDHGTRVVGVVCAPDNAMLTTGIAHALAADPAVKTLHLSSIWNKEMTFLGNEEWTWNVSEAINQAASKLDPGDILLLELAAKKTGWDDGLPIEADKTYAEVIQEVIEAYGVVVIEAAGNEGKDLGDYEDKDDGKGAGVVTFDPNDPGYTDTEAIIVGAAKALYPQGVSGDDSDLPYRIDSASGYNWGSNYGQRVDCYGWGDDVATITNENDNKFTSTFHGTSSAAAVVAGVAACVQSLWVANGLGKLDSAGLRSVLRDTANGTLVHPEDERVLPDLRKIIKNYLAKSPEVYIRDNPEDAGLPHDGSVARSPDVIVRQQAVDDPGAEFGGADQDGVDLSDPVVRGMDHHVYVRVRNRGTTWAADLSVWVYWAKPSTLLTPEQWNPLNPEEDACYAWVPALESGGLAVAGPIVWPAANIPETGHYCFVAWVVEGEGAKPDPTVIESWQGFSAFVRAHPEVAWRNFNVVEMPADDSQIQLAFYAPGAPEKDVEMRLELESDLPDDAKIRLEVPTKWPETIANRGSDFAIEGDVAVLELAGGGGHVLAEGLFPGRSAGEKPSDELGLVVQVPEDRRTAEYEVTVRQFADGTEVGSVTWKLRPAG